MRYFFDVHDGENETRDQDGLECATRDQMRDEAIVALPDIARDEPPNGERRQFRVKVRDGRGRYVFQASLELVAE